MKHYGLWLEDSARWAVDGLGYVLHTDSPAVMCAQAVNWSRDVAIYEHGSRVVVREIGPDGWPNPFEDDGPQSSTAPTVTIVNNYNTGIQHDGILDALTDELIALRQQ